MKSISFEDYVICPESILHETCHDIGEEWERVIPEGPAVYHVVTSEWFPVDPGLPIMEFE